MQVTRNKEQAWPACWLKAMRPKASECGAAAIAPAPTRLVTLPPLPALYFYFARPDTWHILASFPSFIVLPSCLRSPVRTRRVPSSTPHLVLPRSLDLYVHALCKAISSKSSKQYISISSATSARADACYYVLRRNIPTFLNRTRMQLVYHRQFYSI